MAAAVLVAVALAAPSAAVARARTVATPEAMAVVALIDTGINPYNKAFRDRSPLAQRHPSTYIPGYPKDAEALRLTLDVPYDEAMKKDADVWARVRRGELYWIPGTRIIGAMSVGEGGRSCPSVSVPPVNGFTNGDCKEHPILDDHGHGTMTASRAAGAPHSLDPNARIVEIEGLGGQGVRWAADQGWIDVQSNSWLSLIPPPLPSSTTEAFAHAAERTFTIAASGNGTAYIAGFAPTPTYLLSTAPPGVVLVGGHDNGKATLWSGAPPHVVTDAYQGVIALHDSSTKIQPDPIACCTSAAAPYAAGGAAALVTEARRILGDRTTGIDNGVVACGRATVAAGPLEDGQLTLAELKDLYFLTAEAHPSEGRDDGKIHWMGDPRPPDETQYGPGGNPFCIGCTTSPVAWKMIPEQGDAAYPFIGYGGINEHSMELAKDVLRGKAEMPERPGADAQYELDQQLREIFFAATPDDPVEQKDCA